MPSLFNLIFLREKYAKSLNYVNRVKEKEIEFLFENYGKDSSKIEKAFSFKGLNPDIIPYFEKEANAHVVLLFIDITSFSTKVQLMTNNELSNYLDFYYEKTIPMIYKYGGEVEKIIGDGIICVFGQPFLNDNLTALIEKADKCAKEIIIDLQESNWEVKIAIHDGNIQYYKNKSFIEYTMIGQPLTDIFRLESFSNSKSVNYFCDSEYDRKKTQNVELTKIDKNTTFWKRSNKQSVSLKGTNFKFTRHYLNVAEKLKYVGSYDFEYGLLRIFNSLTTLEKINENKSLENIGKNNFQSNGANFSNATILSVDIRLGNLNKFTYLFYQNTFVPEIVNIISSFDEFFDIQFSGDLIIGIFDTPYQYQINSIISCAAMVSSIVQSLDKVVPKINDILKFGIGIDYGEVGKSSIQISNGSLVTQNYTGTTLENSKNLAKKLEKKVIISKVIYSNINKHNKNLFHFDQSREFYYGSIINTKIDEWHKTN